MSIKKSAYTAPTCASIPHYPAVCLLAGSADSDGFVITDTEVDEQGAKHGTWLWEDDDAAWGDTRAVGAGPLTSPE